MTNGSMLKVAGISGSLRKGSTNSAAIRAAIELAPSGVTIEQIGIGDLPLYNDDIRVEGYPPSVRAYREKIAAADAVLFATPEFNYSVSAPLKNAIDWGSRVPDPPYNGKPIGIISASVSPLGGVRAQYHLRHMCVSLNGLVMNTPQVYIGEAPKKLDADFKLVDPATREAIAQFLAAFKDFALRFKR